MLDLFGIANIDTASARIFALKSLVGRHANYTVRVRAQDRGFPANMAYQDVRICVTDFNDHAPRFIRPEQNTTIKIAENFTVGSVIASVAAVDEDAGLNSQIRYALRTDPLGHWKWFHVNETTGDLALAQPLDREKQKLYEVQTTSFTFDFDRLEPFPFYSQIRVQAHDLGVPTSLSSDLDQVVYIRDVNDFPPQFQVDSFQVNFTGNLKIALAASYSMN